MDRDRNALVTYIEISVAVLKESKILRFASHQMGKGGYLCTFESVLSYCLTKRI